MWRRPECTSHQRRETKSRKHSSNFVPSLLNLATSSRAPRIGSESVNRPHHCLSKNTTMSDSEDPIDPVEADEEGDDLFGDENGEERASPKEQFFDDDEELASDPDEDSRPRHRNGFDDDADGVQETRDRVVMAVPTYRHRVPKPKDGAVCAAPTTRRKRMLTL